MGLADVGGDLLNAGKRARRSWIERLHAVEPDFNANVVEFRHLHAPGRDHGQRLVILLQIAKRIDKATHDFEAHLAICRPPVDGGAEPARGGDIILRLVGAPAERLGADRRAAFLDQLGEAGQAVGLDMIGVGRGELGGGHVDQQAAQRRPAVHPPQGERLGLSYRESANSART